jgi:hypothetical protein
MNSHSESVFLVEELQPSSCGTKVEKALYRATITLSPALIFGLLYGLFFEFTKGLIVGLIVLSGTVLGLWASHLWFAWRGHRSLRWFMVHEFENSRSIGSRIGLGVGRFCGGLGGLTFVLIAFFISQSNAHLTLELICELFFGLLVAIFFGLGFITAFGSIGQLIGSIIGWIICGLALTVIPCLAYLDTAFLGPGSLDYITLERMSWQRISFWKRQRDEAFPNQGIKISRNNSLFMFLISGLSTELIGGLFGGLTNGLRNGLTTGLIAAIAIGLVVGLNHGGSAVIKHYALRLILWRKGNIPLDFIKFLDHCAKLILLKKVGGGYIFIHRMLLDYFADLTPPSKVAKDG